MPTVSLGRLESMLRAFLCSEHRRRASSFRVGGDRVADLQAMMGTVIRRERRRQRLTLRALAERAALSVVYLGEIERGKKYPSALVFERLAQALDLDVADLLELVADELRGARAPAARAIGFAIPARNGASPRTVIRQIVGALEP